MQLEMMRCERQNMTLSTKGCSTLWRSAQQDRPQTWEGRFHCLTCPIGATNSGQVMSPVADLVEAIRNRCPRCTRHAARLINGRLCVSCYNREREAIIGKNAKGGRPQLCDRLRHGQIVVVQGMEGRVVDADCIVSAAEAAFALARHAKGIMSFGRAPMHVRSPQFALPL